MLNTRSTHYWLWTLLFGLVAGLARGFNPEFTVVGLTGLVGLLMGIPALSRFARPYDLLIGLAFTVLGVLGILTSFPLAQQIGISASGNILGLSLGIPYALIHTVLGLTSLNHGLKAPPAPSTVAVATEHASNAA
jgi:hypothetical protein